MYYCHNVERAMYVSVVDLDRLYRHRISTRWIVSSYINTVDCVIVYQHDGLCLDGLYLTHKMHSGVLFDVTVNLPKCISRLLSGVPHISRTVWRNRSPDAIVLPVGFRSENEKLISPDAVLKPLFRELIPKSAGQKTRFHVSSSEASGSLYASLVEVCMLSTSILF